MGFLSTGPSSETAQYKSCFKFIYIIGWPSICIIGWTRRSAIWKRLLPVLILSILCWAALAAGLPSPTLSWHTSRSACIDPSWWHTEQFYWKTAFGKQVPSGTRHFPRDEITSPSLTLLDSLTRINFIVSEQKVAIQSMSYGRRSCQAQSNHTDQVSLQ